MRGSEAEERARSWLEAQGLELIARNWRCRGGELDLVMRDGAEVAIIEVRSRARADFGTAAESVARHKQRRIVRAARLLLAQRPELGEQAVRFDVVALDGKDAVEWLRGAFDAE